MPTIETPSYTSTNDTAASAAMVDKKTPLPAPPKFATKEEERTYIKFRLAQAFRIFGEDFDVIYLTPTELALQAALDSMKVWPDTSQSG